ncbi:MAG: transporter, partial [Glaciihabitans sp.]|nr:transporter [Glaciihabitans sp.]
SGLSRTSIYLSAIVSSSVIGLVFGQAPTDADINVIGWVIVVATAGAAILAAVDGALNRPGHPSRPPR